MSSITKTLIGSFAALLVCAGEAALFATDTAAVGPGHSVSVGYAALNPDRPANVATLHRRIAASAARSCPPG